MRFGFGFGIGRTLPCSPAASGLNAASSRAAFAGTGAVKVSGVLAAASQPATCAIESTAGIMAAAAQRATFTCAGNVPRSAALATSSQAATFAGTGTAGGISPAAQLRLQVAGAAITLGSTPKATGTTPPVVTLLAGSRGAGLVFTGDCPGIWIDILGGAATFDISYNSGSTVAHSGVAIPGGAGGGDYTIPNGPAAGCIIRFAAGTYSSTNLYEGRVETLRSTEGAAYTFTQATVANQPLFRSAAVNADSKDALEFVNTGGPYYLISTDAAVYGLFTGDPAFTCIYRVAYTTINAAGYVIGAGNSGQATNSIFGMGQINTGGGQEFITATNSGGTNTTRKDATAIPSTNAHNVCWSSAGSNGTLSIKVNDSAETLDSSVWNIATVSPNRVAIGINPKSTPATGLTAKIYDIAVFSSQLSAGDKTTWHNALVAGTH